MNNLYSQFIKQYGRVLVEVGSYYDEEFSQRGHYKQEHKSKDIFRETLETAQRYDVKLETPSDVWSLYCEDIEQGMLMTLDRYKQYKEEKDRRKNEAFASKLCKESGLKAGTLEFIDYLYSKIEGYDREKYGMKEDGLCCGWGITAEQWYDDYNYLGSKQSEIHDLLSYYEEHLPLLMARYWETKNNDK